jgi:hypothetical protein
MNINPAIQDSAPLTFATSRFHAPGHHHSTSSSYDVIVIFVLVISSCGSLALRVDLPRFGFTEQNNLYFSQSGTLENIIVCKKYDGYYFAILVI